MTKITPNNLIHDEANQLNTSCNTQTANNNFNNSNNLILNQIHLSNQSNLELEEDESCDHEQTTNTGPLSLARIQEYIENRSQSDDDYDLRPKFAILKHNAELLHNNSSSLSSDQTRSGRTCAKTPAWFFNIPTTRSPFPDFESKLPPEQEKWWWFETDWQNIIYNILFYWLQYIA